ncbi:MAG TPA: ABC transporter permease subunit [Jatrophihabitans sp.]|nr:ABC transporter permease subunit [Jatrophihabitans sp.]
MKHERLARPSWQRAAFLGVVVALTIVAVPRLVSRHSWTALAVVLLVTLVLAYVYLSPRRLAARYLVPGTILLLAFQIYPVAYTLSTAFTNYGDGHRLSQSQAIAQLEANSVVEQPGASRYTLSVATRGSVRSGAIVFFLTDDKGQVFEGDQHGLTPVPAGQASTDPITGKVTRVPGWTILTGLQVNARAAELRTFAVPVAGGFIKSVGLSEAYVGQQTLRYDSARQTMTDTRTGISYRPHDGTFVATDGSAKTLEIGWKAGVGFRNFTTVLTDASIRAPFLRVLAWTLAFAVLSVLTTFALGLGLALALDHPALRGQRIYRSLLLLPYALPAFISLLVWQSMYNKDFGLLNRLLHVDVDWLGSAWTARGSILLTNLWLGFPYMFLVCTGVLQSVPAELKEAARVDGASAWRVFRSVTMPLLLVGVTPLLISSFAYNFNSYNTIKLLTDGGPFPSDSASAGQTDILISYTFRLAFGGKGAQYGLAAAISLFIFMLVGLISFAGFQRTRSLEEVYAR